MEARAPRGEWNMPPWRIIAVLPNDLEEGTEEEEEEEEEEEASEPSSRHGGLHQAEAGPGPGSAAACPRPLLLRPRLGDSVVRRRDRAFGGLDGTAAFEPVPHGEVHVRSKEYLRTRIKQPSGPALYEACAVDLFEVPAPTEHIVRHLEIPEEMQRGAPRVEGLPDYLVLQFMVPLDPPSLFSKSLGRGWSFVYTFRLCDDFLERGEWDGARGSILRLLS